MKPHMLDNHVFKCAICEDTVADLQLKSHMQSIHNMIEISEHSNVQGTQINQLEKYTR